MKIICRSSITQAIHQINIDVTKEELLNWVNSGIAIQKCLAKLSPNDREFLLSGATPREFDKMQAGWEIVDYIPEELDSLIITLNKEEIPYVLELIKKYS